MKPELIPKFKPKVPKVKLPRIKLPKMEIARALSFIKNLKIGIKLSLSFALVLVFMTIVFAVGYSGISAMNRAKNDIGELRMPKIKALLTLKESYANIYMLENKLSNFEAGKAASNSLYTEIQSAIGRAASAISDYEKLGRNTEEEELWAYFKEKWEGWLKSAATVVDLSKKRDAAISGGTDVSNIETNMTLSIISPDTLSYALDRIIDYNNTLANESIEYSKSVRRNANIGLIAAFAFGILMAVLLALLLTSAITNPIRKITQISEKIALGDVDVDLKAETYDEIGTLTNAFSQIVEGIKEEAEVSKSIAMGKLDIEITPRSEKDIKNLSMKLIVETLRGLISETQVLIDEAIGGNLSVRGNAENFSGGFYNIINGFNKTLDALTGPIKEASTVLAQLSEGSLDKRVEGDYSGDYSIIKESINKTGDFLQTFIGDILSVLTFMAEGRLDTRIDPEACGGAFKEVALSINRTLNSVIAPINEAADVLQQFSEGNLGVRMEGDYSGDYAKIKQSLNSTIELLHSYINELSIVLGELSKGNLRVSVSGEFKGDFSKLKLAIETIIKSLNSMMKSISTSSEKINAGAEQVSSSSRNISLGATEQAATIEQLTASVSQVAGQTKQNALSALNLKEMMKNVNQSAAEGRKKADEMTLSMEEISTASQNISKIVKMIDQIAFQTSILSLNAAIEAARAGVHGKGFSVVADEVRSLAQMVKNAAQETSNLIEQSMEKVSLGVELAKQTKNGLDCISDEINNALNLVENIATASDEQAQSVVQINTGLVQVSGVVNNSTASAEESAATSEDLFKEAKMLKNLVSQFKIKAEIAAE